MPLGGGELRHAGGSRPPQPPEPGASPTAAESAEGHPAAAERAAVRTRIGADVVALVLAIDVAALLGAAALLSLSLASSLLLLGLIVCLNAAGGHYRPRVAPSLLDEVPGLAARALAAGALVTSFRILMDWTVREGPVSVAVLFLVLACAGRAVGYPMLRRRRVRRGAARPTIVVTCGPVGEQLVATLLEHPGYGLTPVGYVDDSPSPPDPGLRVPVLGGIDALPALVLEHQVTTVVVACSSSQESVMVDVLRTCDRMSCDIFLVPRFFELFGARRENELLQGLPLARLRRAPHRTLGWRCKRALDAGLGTLGLVLLGPVAAACALASRLEAGPGVIVRRPRMGPDGRAFAMLSFRSVPRPGDPDWPASGDLRRAPPVGAVSRMLRHTSLDELPRLWNVVRGDMSLVGPRPERPFVAAARRVRTTARHRVPAGITGWAQINGRDTDRAERVQFADYYVESWSLWEDVKIVLRSAGHALAGRRPATH